MAACLVHEADIQGLLVDRRIFAAEHGPLGQETQRADPPSHERRVTDFDRVRITADSAAVCAFFATRASSPNQASIPTPMNARSISSKMLAWLWLRCA